MTVVALASDVVMYAIPMLAVVCVHKKSPRPHLFKHENSVKNVTGQMVKLIYLSSYCMQMAPPSFSGTFSRKGDSANLYRITSYLRCKMICQKAVFRLTNHGISSFNNLQ